MAAVTVSRHLGCIRQNDYATLHSLEDVDSRRIDHHTRYLYRNSFYDEFSIAENGHLVDHDTQNEGVGAVFDMNESNESYRKVVKRGLINSAFNSYEENHPTCHERLDHCSHHHDNTGILLNQCYGGVKKTVFGTDKRHVPNHHSVSFYDKINETEVSQKRRSSLTRFNETNIRENKALDFFCKEEHENSVNWDKTSPHYELYDIAFRGGIKIPTIVQPLYSECNVAELRPTDQVKPNYQPIVESDKGKPEPPLYEECEIADRRDMKERLDGIKKSAHSAYNADMNLSNIRAKDNFDDLYAKPLRRI